MRNWTLGSRAIYYSQDEAKNHIFVLDQRQDQFDLWNQSNPIGKNLILIIEKEKQREHLAGVRCQNLTEITTLQVKKKDAIVNEISYYLCKDLQSWD